LKAQLVLRHRHEQLEQLIRLLEFVLPRRRPHEEAGHHGLADVHGVERGGKPGIAEPEADGAANGRLVALDQQARRILVASPHLLD
jgi:hypothetical protein